MEASCALHKKPGYVAKIFTTGRKGTNYTSTFAQKSGSMFGWHTLSIFSQQLGMNLLTKQWQHMAYVNKFATLASLSTSGMCLLGMPFSTGEPFQCAMRAY